MQILPGIYLLNGSPYGRHQNGYLVRAGGATILVDSGDLEDAAVLPEVEGNARRWGLELSDASHLLVTHAHFDHASHAAELRRRGVKVVASRETSDAMAAGDDRCIGYAVHRAFEPCAADVVVDDGARWRVADLTVSCRLAPGHAPGMTVFETDIDGARCWFVGDLLLTQHAHRGVDLGWGSGPGFDRAAYLDSLRALKDLPCDHLFPGHGPPAIGCGRRVVEMAYTKAMTDWRGTGK